MPPDIEARLVGTVKGSLFKKYLQVSGVSSWWSCATNRPPCLNDISIFAARIFPVSAGAAEAALAATGTATRAEKAPDLRASSLAKSLLFMLFIVPSPRWKFGEGRGVARHPLLVNSAILFNVWYRQADGKEELIPKDRKFKDPGKGAGGHGRLALGAGGGR